MPNDKKPDTVRTATVTVSHREFRELVLAAISGGHADNITDAHVFAARAVAYLPSGVMRITMNHDAIGSVIPGDKDDFLVDLDAFDDGEPAVKVAMTATRRMGFGD